MSMLDDPRRITEFLEPEKLTIGQYGGVCSRHGKVTNHDWLEREMARINKGDKKCEIVAYGKFEALFYIDYYYSFAVREWIKYQERKACK